MAFLLSTEVPIQLRIKEKRYVLREWIIADVKTLSKYVTVHMKNTTTFRCYIFPGAKIFSDSAKRVQNAQNNKKNHNEQFVISSKY